MCIYIYIYVCVCVCVCVYICGDDAFRECKQLFSHFINTGLIAQADVEILPVQEDKLK